MNWDGFERKKSDGGFESDHVVLKDCNNNELDLFWFVHEVVVQADGCDCFCFSKKDCPDVYAFLTDLAKQIEGVDKHVCDGFVKNGSFVWHNMSRAWDRPFEEEAGFAAKLCGEAVEIKFFPGLHGFGHINSNNKFFISLGGPDGFVEPHQSISNIFAMKLNELLDLVPCEEEKQR